MSPDPLTGDPEPPNVLHRIVGMRRQDRAILTMAMVASAAAATPWLPFHLILIWLGATLSTIMASHIWSDRLFGHPGIRMSDEWYFAILTFAASAIYAMLPLALVINGSQLAILTGVCIAGVQTIRSTNEFAVSRSVGGAGLAAIMAVAVVGALLKTLTATPAQLVAVLVSVVVFFVYILQHAASRHRAELGMAEALDQAERNAQAARVASEAKSAFLATMSHEIRTPLNGVLGMTQALAAADATPAQRRQLAVIEASGAALKAVLDDVLDLARVEAGKLEIVSMPFAPAEILTSVCDVFSELAQAKDVRFERRIDPSALGLFSGDPARLRQVVSNLLSNAVKFTDAGVVTVEADVRDGVYCISIADTGIGIPADRMSQLFQKFSQIDSSSTRRHGGSGLGLSISRALCDLMGGDILVDSVEGRGTRFTVQLPLAPLSGPSDDDSRLPDLPAIAPRPALRVLAAEDHAVNQIVLKTLLEQAGLAPLIVSNGEAAVAAWDEADWDVILMDMQMPVMDGLQATRVIRRREIEEGRPRTPIIALTANAMVHQVAEYRHAGMDACVAKPINAAQLLTTLESVVEEALAAGVAAAGQAHS